MGALKDKLIEEQTAMDVLPETLEQTEQTEQAVQVVQAETTDDEEDLTAELVPEIGNIWSNQQSFVLAQRMGKLLAASEIAPQSYKGKVADCVIAIDIANRMGVSPLTVMQSSQVVNGNFSWKGTACKAMIDACGKYTNTRYVEVGERGTDSWGYYLEATDKQGNIVKGVTVDIAMAKADGWYNRNPKWKSMTELMLKYRAAAFFMRTECAGLSMGFLTTEEYADIPK